MIPEKYGIPEETYKAMIRDGVISCSWPRFEAVYKCYQKHMAIKADGAQTRTAEELDIPLSTVNHIVKRFRG
jgi:hypothetical protein